MLFYKAATREMLCTGLPKTPALKCCISLPPPYQQPPPPPPTSSLPNTARTYRRSNVRYLWYLSTPIVVAGHCTSSKERLPMSAAFASLHLHRPPPPPPLPTLLPLRRQAKQQNRSSNLRQQHCHATARLQPEPSPARLLGSTNAPSLEPCRPRGQRRPSRTPRVHGPSWAVHHLSCPR